MRGSDRDELATWFIGFCCGALVTAILFVAWRGGLL